MRPTGGFELLDHRADIGIRAHGASIEEAFVQVARGMFSVMVDLESVQAISTESIELDAGSADLLLVDWLANLLAEKDLSGLVFTQFDVHIVRSAGGWHLRGIAKGEALDSERHRPHVEVKGISHMGLRVERQRETWMAQCVLDV